MNGLNRFDQFILWTLAERDGKKIKLPISPHTMRTCSVTDHAQFVPYDVAAAMASTDYGVAFVLTDDDPFFFIDVDHALQPDGSWSALATALCHKFSGAFIEVSQSGSGLHILGASTSTPAHACKNIELGLELYTSGRFVALTGTNAVGDAYTDHTAALCAAAGEYFAPRSGEAPGPAWSNEPVDGWSGPEDDGELLKKALKSKSAAGLFGGKCSFSDLWTADEGALCRTYPDSIRAYDASSADAALAQHLAFWTGKNHERIMSLMMRSRLKREKWEREDYLQRTIENAVRMQRDVYTDKKRSVTETVDPYTPIDSGATVVTGFQYLSADMQIKFFAGCTYVQDLHRVLTPSGDLLRSEQFNAIYGGYVFQIDDTGKVTTRKAWDAFTESQVVRQPKAHGMCFLPNKPFGAVFKDSGRTTVNVYLPIDTPRKPGDPAPFLDHLARILPDIKDRTIILSYMAACLQHKGTKFQWAPLLQGVEGNGKTLLTRCVSYAVGRKYVHYPKAADIDNKFNGWLLNKLFIGVEDIYVADNRREVIETLKPMITGGDGLEIQLKGVDQVTADICANFMLNSNHKDAIRKTTNDRRFAVFYTAQQDERDLKRDGMDGAYFPNLYAWFNGGGYAVVSEYLHTYVIPDEYNPATMCHRAPTTSSTLEVLAVSMGSVEQEISEAISEGRPGFAGGWVSSMALDRLLQGLRMTRAIPVNRRRDMLRSIGYDWHPALKNGRSGSRSVFDAGRPRLFVLGGSAAAAITDSLEATRAYDAAQSGMV